MVTKLLKLLRPFWPLTVFSTAMGALSGVTVVMLIATTNRALQSEHDATTGLLLAFGGLCLVTLIGEVVSDLGTNLVGQRMIAALRKDLCAKILSAPIAQIEQFRTERVLVTLNQDIETISQFSFLFSSVAIAAAVTTGCVVYLVILSPLMSLAAIVALVAGAGIHYAARSRGIVALTASRDATDELQQHYRVITEGAKELRLSRPRRFRVLSQHIGATIERICDLRMRGTAIFCSANAFGSLLYLMVIGLMLAIHGAVAGDKSLITGFVLVLLFMKGPLQQLVGALPIISRAQVSFSKVAELSARFTQQEPHIAADDRPSRYRSIDMIELRGVRYVFPAPDHGRAFELGPIDLTIRRGEILFITGENGCGKTTLIKLLLGLYRPSEGTILLDGQPIADEMLDDYRQLFSAVFFDYQLFADLVVGVDQRLDAADEYLQKLELAHKVKILDGAFSTVDLSAGQRKRLALIQVYLEGRPVLIFDEWAAEQDPTFRRIFYTELLPELKRQGKTLIVISHDDRYYDVADHRIALQFGRVMSAANCSH
jgi:putative pyoverdin transport system ATP-binding/permease protein